MMISMVEMKMKKNMARRGMMKRKMMMEEETAQTKDGRNERS